MPVDHFTKEKFESALLEGWKYLGLISGEHCYIVPVGEDVGVYIRSSVGASKQSAGAGEDSIRCFLVDRQLKPLARKLVKWTTRVKGWERRLEGQIEGLRRLGQQITSPCADCGGQLYIGTTQAGPNEGKRYRKCQVCGKFAGWIEENVLKLALDTLANMK